MNRNTELNDEPLDDRRDRMVSALYGELDQSEERALEEAIKSDPELETEWQELRAMRRMMRLAEAVPNESASLRPTAPPINPARKVVASLVSTRLAASGLGFAAAATLFVILLVNGLRVDRTPDGLLVRLDGSLASDLAAASVLDDGRAIPNTSVSKAEMVQITQALAGATAARLSELERRQVESQAEMTRALYDALSINQQQQYADLRNRIERVAYTAAAGPRAGVRGSTQQINQGGMSNDH